MATIARFTIPGEPVSKQRARVTKRGTYTPDKTMQAEEKVGWLFRQAAPDYRIDPEATYGMTARFYVSSKRRRDLDNMLKLLLDALNGIAWKDDTQVCSLSCVKRVASPAEARTEVEIEMCVEAAS